MNAGRPERQCSGLLVHGDVWEVASCLTAAVRRNARLEDALDLFDVGVLADCAHHVHQMTAVAVVMRMNF